MYLGADISYINEIEDLGGRYQLHGRETDPFVILQSNGANIARMRLWHTPTRTNYSTLTDVEKTIRRAKSAGMKTLLDFHYSDTWADPAKQHIPAAWLNIADTTELAEILYQYTVDTLLHLYQQNLMPDFVQIGNEINTEILMPTAHVGEAIRWERNAKLLNAGIRAVKVVNQQMQTAVQSMLHIAQPENLITWFDDALAAGVQDFDLIGMSYYPKWSSYSIDIMGKTIQEARKRYNKALMLVEIAYPWTLEHYRSKDHLLSHDALLEKYPATAHGQLQFLTDVTQTVYDNGGIGVVYWEPAWISTPQKASIWENSTLFNYENEIHDGIKFLSHDYSRRAE